VLGEELVEQLALSSRCPMTPGLRSVGCTSMSVRVMFMSPQRTSSAVPVQLFRPRRELDHEAQLRLVVLAAVGHVHRGDDEAADFGLHDPRLHVEFGMAERGLGVEQPLRM